MRHDRHEVTAGFADPAHAESAFSDARERLLRYRIFPESILRPLVDSPDGLVREGSTVAFHASVPLIRASIEAAVRVLSVWEAAGPETAETGLEIATLAGHPERGHERFTLVHERADRRVRFTIEAWSRPGSIFVRLAGPLGRMIQARAARAALNEFADQAGRVTSSTDG
jgi:uncharacterized protein (UPF0548 family)